MSGVVVGWGGGSMEDGYFGGREGGAEKDGMCVLREGAGMGVLSEMDGRM